MKIPPTTRLLILAALIPLASCTQNTKPGPARPARTAQAAPLPPVPNAAATISESERGRTAHIGLGETVAIRLNVDESTGNRWFLANQLEGNILFKKGATTYARTPSGDVATLLYQSLRAGRQELHFYYAPPDSRQNPSRTADFAVIVR